MDPVYQRPDAYAALAEAVRREHAGGNEDYAHISLPDTPRRFFVRGVLQVPIAASHRQLGWGFWVEVSRDTLQLIGDVEEARSHGTAPLLAGELANRINGYPSTVGLPVMIRLTGPRTRPLLTLPTNATHPFAVHCRGPIDVSMAMEWSHFHGRRGDQDIAAP